MNLIVIFVHGKMYLRMAVFLICGSWFIHIAFFFLRGFIISIETCGRLYVRFTNSLSILTSYSQGPRLLIKSSLQSNQQDGGEAI